MWNNIILSLAVSTKLSLIRMFCECEKKCQNILMSRAQTSGTIFMIFLYIAQNFDSIIGAKFQDPSFKD